VTLAYIYGPPAVGKLTVAEQLAALTGYALFPNHLTFNAVAAVVPPSSRSFETLNRVRLPLVSRGYLWREGYDLHQQLCVGWGGGARAVRGVCCATRETVQGAGGRTLFVHLHASLEVLESRVVWESGESHGKLRDVGALRRLLEGYAEGPLENDHLSVDTSSVPPADVARLILARCL
jgi:hypothetical protein